jgi:hypothetical protein
LSTNIPDIVNRPSDTLSTLAAQKPVMTTPKPSAVVVPSAVNKISQPDNNEAPNEKSTSKLSKAPFDINVM